MTKYKERDDALIAEAERLATKATQSTTKSLAWIEECQSALIHLVRSNWQPAPKPDRAEEKSVDTSFQGNRSPTHRCKVCGALWILYSDAWSLCSKECGKCCNNVLMGEQIEPLLHSDLVTWMELPSNMPEPDRAEVLFDELYGKTKDEQIDCFCRHFAELRAEWEAERLEIPPHKHYSTPLIERLNGPHEWGYRDPVEGGFIADMSPSEASDRLSELEAERQDEPVCFIGKVDCDGNELVTVSKDALDRYKDQARYTYQRAEKAEARVKELEAERPAVVVPREAKLWADSVGYCSATRYEERTTAKWIKSLDGAKGPAVVVPMSAKMWAESVLNLRGAINATCEREAARFILSIDGAKGDE